MWVEIKKTSNLIVAEAWKEYLEDAGVPCQIRPEALRLRDDIGAGQRVMVPTSRLAVAEDVLSRC